jgi:hypothetical protein
MTPTRPGRTAAATLAALAFAAPAATARPIDPPLGMSTDRERPAAAEDLAPSPVIVRTADEGFDWGSAGIGAAATGGLVLVAVGGLAAAHRARTRLAP